MTLYGWDSSHYDGTLTTAVLTKAKAEGISFFTHKLGEGDSNADPAAAGAFAAARAAGIPVIGGYYFIHSGDMVAQADRCIALADKLVPWWREFAGWFWQTDAEFAVGGKTLPSPAEVKQFSDHLAANSGRACIVYASAGEYGNRLSGLGHELWNANYGTNPHGAFKDIYPGDNSRGWNAYSGQVPALLQYGSNATIAGLTTCDANAFRGTLYDLLTLIGATDMPLTDADVTRVWAADVVPSGDPANSTWETGNAIGWLVAQARAQTATLAGIVKTETAIQAALAAGGSTADSAAIIKAIQAVGTQESAAVTALQQQNAALSAQVVSLRAALAKAAADAAGDLAAAK